ncbi:hypothetical protein [Verrucosispora sp. WMMC514]|uniref:hypothetical protein n=1 Tax=Verrucosispora sp. WMMC514 TaxID=3015156 RepID=UPI00248CA080|nr:hypothetical protein [Verrucosispora sp. WMMC514]WBB89937.1 hypothetical protein O7597_23570 [Verrucosispora sp. WMMC514]
MHRLAQPSGGLPIGIALRVIGGHIASPPSTSLGDPADELADRLLDIDGDDWSGRRPEPALVYRDLGQVSFARTTTTLQDRLKRLVEATTVAAEGRRG